MSNLRTYWRREMRIMDFCVNHARQIIAELESAGGDHHEDVQELLGLIEVWEYLSHVAEEGLRKEERKESPAPATTRGADGDS